MSGLKSGRHWVGSSGSDHPREPEGRDRGSADRPPPDVDGAPERPEPLSRDPDMLFDCPIPFAAGELAVNPIESQVDCHEGRDDGICAQVKAMGAGRLVAAGLVVAVLSCGDGGPTTPTPAPSPSGVPHATAFANLALVQALERASGRNWILAGVSARIDRTGRVQPGGTWYYTFLHPSNKTVVTQWRVTAEGTVTSDTYGSCGFETAVDMTPLLGLDSDRVLELALAHGTEALLQRVSEPKSLTINYVSGFVRVRVEAPDCYFLHNGIEIDPGTGALLRADESCTGTPMRPCVMPGVF